MESTIDYNERGAVRLSIERADKVALTSKDLNKIEIFLCHVINHDTPETEEAFLNALDQHKQYRFAKVPLQKGDDEII